ncbi:MAG: hypothetical protein ACXWV9_07105 [Flavisolibacter sp.]
MEDKNITEQEGLRLINQMIRIAKVEQADDGRDWILWGWMLLLASVLTILNIRFQWFKDLYTFWNAIGIITILIYIYEFIQTYLKRKKTKVKTYTQELFNKLNTGFFISLVFIIVAINIAKIPLTGFSLLINLYAFWILIYGTALNFKPSVIAAYITWTIGLASLLMKTFEMVMAMHALAALCGYIIPGYIANREFKKLHREDNISHV